MSAPIGTQSSSGEQDWRLVVELEPADASSAVRRLVGLFRGPNPVEEIQESAPRDVVITHDGRRLFAYAAAEATLTATRGAIEDVLRRDGLHARVTVSRWDQQLDLWRQLDPAPTAEQARMQRADEREAEAITTSTFVVSSGKAIRAEVQQSMRAWAEKLGLECEVVEHPHLLSTQLAFTVTGPRRKVAEFAQGLAAEERATMRTETTVMTSPL